jgi:DNA polymerase delta subunit 1
MMDSEEMEVDVVIGDGPENENTSQRWARPALPIFNPKTDAVVFQQIDVDHYVGQPMAGMPGAQVSNQLIFNLKLSFNCIISLF